MEVNILPIEKTAVTKEQLLFLIKEAFRERKDVGLNYRCLTLSMDGFLKEIRDSEILVAIDGDTGTICGCTILLLRQDKDGSRFGREKHTSVHPDYKEKGIGSMLITALREKAVENQCEYIVCSTAVEAVSAVKVHLKNGYHIVGLKSYKMTNYYSYLFRMQLTPSLWSDAAYCRRQYIKSACRVRIAYKPDGSKTIAGRILSKFGINW